MLLACASSEPSETDQTRSCCVRPDRLLPGDNLFSVGLRGAATNANYLVTLQAFNGDHVACSASQRIQARDEGPEDVKLVLPTDLDARPLDLEVAVTDEQTGRVTNKGTIKHGGDRWCFYTVIADAAGNLLAAVGPWGQTRWRLCRYQPRQDTLQLSDFELEGLLFNDPHKNVYLLCNDGRLYEWSASEDRLILRARYALGNMGRLRCAALRSTGEWIVPRGSIRGGGKPNVRVLVFATGRTTTHRPWQSYAESPGIRAIDRVHQHFRRHHLWPDRPGGGVRPARQAVHIYSVACKTRD